MAVWIGSSFDGDELVPRTSCSRSSSARSPARSGRASPGFLKATVGAHEVISTIMLNWIAVWVGDLPVRPRGAAPERHAAVRADLERRRRGREAPGVLGRPAPAGPPHRLLRGDRGARRLLADPQPDDPRLRRPGRRLQPRGGALQRHQRLEELLPGDGDLGRVRRPCGGDRHPRLGVPLSTNDVPGSAPAVAFIGIAVALLGRNTAVGVALAALLFGGARDGTSTRNLDPRSSSPSSQPT